MILEFTKLHGIGNDFVVCRLPSPDALDDRAAIALADRHFGVGGDGVLLVSPGESPGARARMTVINADGSRPEMCGNGLRCVALFESLREEGVDFAGSVEFVVDTDAGPRRCLVERDPARPSSRALVTTALGRGVLEGSFEHSVGGRPASFHRVSMGNPHAITFGPQVSAPELDELGAAIGAATPGGTNVEVATLAPDGAIDVAVFERGVGRTLACGTGAAATAVAAVLLGHRPAGAPIVLRLPGGALELLVDDALAVTLRGPAEVVFSGRVVV
jgi:diaminopimelate epimerase